MVARVTTLLIIALTLGCIPGCASGGAKSTTVKDDSPPTASSPRLPTRFGISADAHLMDSAPPQHEAFFRKYVDAMCEWKPDFVIDLGDFACQCRRGGKTAPELHDCQLEGLKRSYSLWQHLPCPRRHVLGNHDAGRIRGGEEIIKPQDLYERGHRGEDITKDEFLAVTRMPGRYYSFDVNGYHFIVLDGSNQRDDLSIPAGRDGIEGTYWIDDAQKAWLARDLAANRPKFKLLFSHQELHHTPIEGSREGGDRPFRRAGKEDTYIDNGWQIREMLRADGRVLACFAGHKHQSRWTVHGGVNYITLAALHRDGYAKVTLSDKLYIEGVGSQKSYTLDMQNALSGENVRDRSQPDLLVPVP